MSILVLRPCYPRSIPDWRVIYVVDTYFIYRASDQYHSFGAVRLANGPSALLALVEGGMARWFYRRFIANAIFLSESFG